MKYSKNFSILREGEKIIQVHKRKNGLVEVIHPHPTQYYADSVIKTDLAGNKLVGFFRVVPNIVERPSLWKSEYRGDDLPMKDCTCMVTIQGRSGGLLVSAATYISALGGFIGDIQPVGFIPLDV